MEVLLKGNAGIDEFVCQAATYFEKLLFVVDLFVLSGELSLATNYSVGFTFFLVPLGHFNCILQVYEKNQSPTVACRN